MMLMKRIMALMLSAAILLTMLPSALAQNAEMVLQVMCNDKAWDVELLHASGIWYAEVKDLAALAGCEVSTTTTNNTIMFVKEKRYILHSVSKEQCISEDGSWYVPLQETSVKLGVRFYVDEDVSADVFKTPAQLQDDMAAIFKDQRYQIDELRVKDWWGAAEFFARVYNILPFVGDSSVLDEATGTGEADRYQEAMTNILSYEADMSAFIQDVDDVADEVSEYADLLESAHKLLKKDGELYKYLQSKGVDQYFLDVIEFKRDPYDNLDGFFEGWSDFLELINFEHFLDVCAYYSVALDVEESILIAMKHVFVDSDNAHAKAAALKLYEHRFGDSGIFLADVYGGTLWDSVEEYITDHDIEMFYGDKAALTKLLAAGIDKLTGASDKSGAIIYASTYAEIQQDLSAYYHAHKEDTAVYTMYDMRAVTIMYLKAVISFYEMLAFDKDLESTVEYALSVMNADLEIMLSYSKEEYAPTYTNNELINWLNGVELTYGEGEASTSTSRYEIIDQSMTWTEASEYCKAQGGHLVTIESQEEMEFVTKQLLEAKRNCYWIGLYYDREMEKWCYEDGTEAQYFNWAPNEPNAYEDNDENYVHLFGRRYTEGKGIKEIGQWNDCGQKGAAYASTFYALKNFGFICEWDLEGQSASAQAYDEAALRVYAEMLRQDHWLKTAGRDVLATHYHLFDMNQDGVPEIILYGLGDGLVSAFVVYTYAFGKPVMIADSVNTCDLSYWFNAAHYLSVCDGRYVYAAAGKSSASYEASTDSVLAFDGFQVTSQQLAFSEVEKLIENSRIVGGIEIGSAADYLFSGGFNAVIPASASGTHDAENAEVYRAYADLLRSCVIWSNDARATHYQLYDAENDGIPEIVVYNVAGGYGAGFAEFSYEYGAIALKAMSGKYYNYQSLYLCNGSEVWNNKRPDSYSSVEDLIINREIVGGIRIGSAADFITAEYARMPKEIAADAAEKWGKHQAVLKAYAELLAGTVHMWAPMNTPATHYALFDENGDGIPELVVFGRDQAYDSAGFEVYSYEAGEAVMTSCGARNTTYHTIHIYEGQILHLNGELSKERQHECLVQNGAIVGGIEIGSAYDYLRNVYGQ